MIGNQYEPALSNCVGYRSGERIILAICLHSSRVSPFFVMTSAAAPPSWTYLPGLPFTGYACKKVLDRRSLLSLRIARTMEPGLETAATCPESHASLLPEASCCTTPGGIILLLNMSVYAFTPAMFC